MRQRVVQYLNEIVSIAVMLLMAIALIAGQAAPMSIGADDRANGIPYQSVRATGDE